MAEPIEPGYKWLTAEQAVEKAGLRAIAGMSLPLDRLSTWLLAFAAAAVGIIVSNLGEIERHISDGCLQAVMWLLGLSGLAGLGARAAGAFWDIRRRAQHAMERDWEGLETQTPADEDFGAALQAAEPKIAALVPWYRRNAAAKVRELARRDPLYPDRSLARLAIRQSELVILQFLLVVVAVLTLAIGIN